MVMVAPRPRRRRALGKAASAALPIVWRAMRRKGWTQADLARALEISTAAASGLVYGDFRPGRRVTDRCRTVLGTKADLWDKPVPADWTPHEPAAPRGQPPAQ
jgi:transcriptional regulator with XRE-family HTH domain